MNILKRGKIVDKETITTCYKCKTEFSYINSDTDCDRDGYYVKCPVCEAFISTGPFHTGSH